MLLPLHSMMVVEWVAVPRVGFSLGVGGVWNLVLLPFPLVAERRQWGLGSALALPLPFPNLGLQCY